MIDKSKIKAIHSDLDATLKAFAAKHNLTVSPFNITYSPSGFKCTVQMGDKNELGEADPVLARNLERHGFWYNLDKSMLKKEFNFHGQKVILEGMKNKTTVIYRSSVDGKLWRTDGNRFCTAVGITPKDGNRGLPLADFGR